MIRDIETEEKKRLRNLVRPYIKNGELVKNAPQEVVNARRKLFELSLEEGQT